ncbi:MAG TPA: signal peptidase I [Thermoanaerobaculia bacterium]
MDAEPGTTKPRRPWIAALLTLLVPGLGQLYGGEPGRAIAVYLGYVVLLAGLLLIGLPKTFSGLIVFLLALLAYVLWVVWDAVRIARRKQDYVLKPCNRWYGYVAAVLVANLLIGPRLLALSPVKAFRIPSGSMEPAVRVGDHLYADMAGYRSARPSRGDLVIFVSPDSSGQKLGRVIGLPGERIELRNKLVYVDGQRLGDPWGHARKDQPALVFSSPALRARDDLAPVAIPGDSVFILGDNRDNSYDSRFYGPVPVSSLQGRALYIYWSPDRSRIGMSLR